MSDLDDLEDLVAQIDFHQNVGSRKDGRGGKRVQCRGMFRSDQRNWRRALKLWLGRRDRLQRAEIRSRV